MAGGNDLNTKLLLHFDGTDGQTATTDSSSAGHAITPVAAAQIDTDQSKFGGSSALFAAGPDYYQAANHTDFDIHDGTNKPMTIDFWCRFNTVASSHGFCHSYTSSSNYWFIRWWTGGTMLMQMRTPGAIKQLKCNWSPAADQWYHVAFVRSASTRYIFIDGVPQSLTVDTTGAMAALTSPLEVGRSVGEVREMDGWIEEFRVSDIARWEADFSGSLPTEEYSTPPIVNTDIEVFQPQPAIPMHRWLKKKANSGWSDSPGLNVPVPIKMDKWFSPTVYPVRTKPRNKANVTQHILVDFSVPTLPEVTLDKWFFQSPIPRKRFEKKIARQSEFLLDFVAGWQENNGNFQDTGAVVFSISDESPDTATFADSGAVEFSISQTHVEDFQFEDAEPISFSIGYPERGNESFNSGVPGYISANVIIDGVNESDNIKGNINITREDNTAARFKCIIELDQTLVPARKPSELINKVVAISFSAADMSGTVSDYVPLFIGLCKHVEFNDNIQSIVMSGYDYGGVHQTRGEFVSANITDVLTGTVYASSAGTISIGHSPVWGVVWGGNSAVIDGTDYFINTLNGEIIIPVSSRILQFPGSFTYNYMDPFDSMKAIIEGVMTLKGWNVTEDNVTIADYSSTAEHPVLSLSNESAIDVCRKFLELSGAKVETNLFPKLRVYSEVQNVINTVNTHVVDESIIFGNSVVFRVDFDNIINEQTTRTVQKINANVVIGSGSTIAEFSGSQGTTDPRRVQTDVVWWSNFDISTPTVLVEHRIKKAGLNSISFSSTGTFSAALIPFETFEETITGASWNTFTDGDDFVIQLKHNIVVLGGGGITLWAYPAVDYTLTVSGSKINYGDGAIEDIKSVTAQRPIAGIVDTLAGDVYENPYAETDQHCANICDAILLEHGNPYTTSFEIPLFEGKDLNIGDMISIERDSVTRFTGIVKRLSYSINLSGGQNSVTIDAKGVGFGI